MGYEKSAHLYDLFDRKDNIDFFFHYAQLSGEVLDVGAGTGRIAIPLAERCVKVCCVEPSPAMRREFENKLAACGDITGRIQLIAGDAATFGVEQVYPMAFLSGCFDHFFDEKERIDSLKNINRHLTPGGILVFDVFLGLMENRPLSVSGEAKWRGQVIRRFVGSRILSPERLWVKLVYEVYQGEEMVERIEEHGLVGITDRQDLHRILWESGFDVKHKWVGYDFIEYKDGDTLLIVEAAKQ
jgi:SAM-dependent methyltransferase